MGRTFLQIFVLCFVMTLTFSQGTDMGIAGKSYDTEKLIPGADGGKQIAYGDFPHIACVPELAPLAWAFARNQLNPEGKLREREYDMFFETKDKLEAKESFLRKWSDPYTVLYNDKGEYSEETVYFEASPVNLLLLLNLTESERAYLESEGGTITAVEFAKTRNIPVCITWGENTVDDLSREQLSELLSGDIADWSELGGGPFPVKKYYYLDGNLELLLDTHIMDGKAIADPEMDSQDIPNGLGEGDGYTIETFIPYINEQGSFGITDYDSALAMEGVKILTIDGFAPGEETLESGEYPLINSCFAVYWDTDKALAPGMFIDWLRSAEGADLIKTLGWVPAVDN